VAHKGTTLHINLFSKKPKFKEEECIIVLENVHCKWGGKYPVLDFQMDSSIRRFPADGLEPQDVCAFNINLD